MGATAAAGTTAGAGCGSSITGLLTIAFVVLKLTHEIAWSWWWVLSPLWVLAAIWIAVLVVVLGFIGAAGAAVLGKRER